MYAFTYCRTLPCHSHVTTLHDTLPSWVILRSQLQTRRRPPVGSAIRHSRGLSYDFSFKRADDCLSAQATGSADGGFDGLSELIGTGGSTRSAGVSAKRGSYLTSILSLNETTYSLEVSVTAAREDDVVELAVLKLERYCRGAGSLCTIRVLHFCCSFLFIPHRRPALRSPTYHPDHRPGLSGRSLPKRSRYGRLRSRSLR